MATEAHLRKRRQAAYTSIVAGLIEHAKRLNVVLPPFPTHVQRFDFSHRETFIIEWVRRALTTVEVIPAPDNGADNSPAQASEQTP